MSEATAPAAEQKAAPAGDGKAEAGAPPAPKNGEGGKPDPKGEKAEAEQTVPLGALKDLERKLKGVEKELAGYKGKEQEAADKATQAAGDVAKAQQERDGYKGRAEKGDAYASARVKALRDALDDEGKAVLDAIPDAVDVWDRLIVAEKLAGRKAPAPGFGSKGGGGPEKKPGLIPADITTPAQYREWMQRTASPRATREERDIHVNPEKSAARDREAKERGLR